MNRKGNYVIGAIFIILGALFMLNNLDLIDFDWMDLGFLMANFWPMFVIIPGLAMHHSFFSGKSKDAGILVPGGILLTVGIVFQISMLFNLWHVMWPGFILAVAVGLFELYYFGTREKGLLIPVGILGGLSLIFFSSFSLGHIFRFRIGSLIFPVVLITIGAVILAGNGNKKF